MITKEITGTKKIFKTDFSSGSYTFAEKKPPVSSFGREGHKG